MYEYDSLNQLTKETLKDGTIKEYSYDGFGNRINVNVIKNGNATMNLSKYNEANQLINFDNEKISYDPNGIRTEDGQYKERSFFHIIDLKNL